MPDDHEARIVRLEEQMVATRRQLNEHIRACQEVRAEYKNDFDQCTQRLEKRISNVSNEVVELKIASAKMTTIAAGVILVVTPVIQFVIQKFFGK